MSVTCFDFVGECTFFLSDHTWPIKALTNLCTRADWTEPLPTELLFVYFITNTKECYNPLGSKHVSYQYTRYVAFYESVTSFLDMEQMEFITEHFGIKRYRSVAAVCAIYPDAHTVETYLYLKLTSFCVHILIIVLVRVLILVKLIFWTAIFAHQVIISVSVWYGKYTTHWLKTCGTQPASNLVPLSACR